MLKVAHCEMLFLLFVLEKFIKLKILFLKLEFWIRFLLRWIHRCCFLKRVMQKSSVEWKLTMRDETSGDWTRLLIARLPTTILVKVTSLHRHFCSALLNGIFWRQSLTKERFIKRSFKKFNSYCLSRGTCNGNIFIEKFLYFFR